MTAALLIGLEWIILARRGQTGEVVLKAYDTVCMHARRKKGRWWGPVCL